MSDKNVVPAILEVIYETRGQVVQREFFLIWYSSEQYPTPATFREYLKIGLHEFLQGQKTLAKEAGSFSVAIKTNDIVGHFLNSGKFPGLIASAKRFTIKFSHK